jgi:hypothetical protein
MSREERFGTRDLTYSSWHRRAEPSNRNVLTYIDLDAIEYCHRCREPLALLELARDVGQTFKPTTVLKALAERADVPAYLVFYKPDESGNIIGFRMRQVYPRAGEFISLTPDEYAGFLVHLRSLHVCGGNGNGDLA